MAEESRDREEVAVDVEAITRIVERVAERVLVAAKGARLSTSEDEASAARKDFGEL